MIENQLFSRLSIYAPSSAISQSENYLTEIFVFLLDYSKSKNNCFWKLFLQLLTNNYPSDDETLNITTQEIFKIPKIVKPDIVITYNNKKFIIEVKLDSKLNTYWYKNKNMDQIELYKNIPNVSDIFLIEKRYNKSNFLNEKKHISWYKIGQLVKVTLSNDCIWNFLASNFQLFLERNGIMSAKISSALRSGVSEIKNLMINISVSLDEYKCKYVNESDPTAWFGYNIKNGRKVIAWIGLSVNDPEYLWFEVSDETLIRKMKKRNSGFNDINIQDFGLKFASNFIINSEYYEKDADSQKNEIQDWIKVCLKEMKYGEFA